MMLEFVIRTTGQAADGNMQALTTGVAVITYNGLKYLPQQLDSIVAQTRVPEHIVVSDDRSTDGTWAFLQDWAQRCPVRVTLIRNEQQLGLTGNFEQAIGAVEADIVFTADQDDIWLGDKVERLARVFETEPEVLLVHTDATLVDADDRDLGTTLLGELGLTDAERSAIAADRAFEVYCRRNVVTGATAAFRRSLLQVAHPLPRTMYHDTWLAFMASGMGKVRLLEVPMIRYRQHGGNLVGMKKLGRVERLRRLWWAMNGSYRLSTEVGLIVDFRVDVHTRLAAQRTAPPAHLALAAEALAFARRRGSLPRNPLLRAGAVLQSTAARRYHRFSNRPWSDAFRDVVSR